MLRFKFWAQFPKHISFALEDNPDLCINAKQKSFYISAYQWIQVEFRQPKFRLNHQALNSSLEKQWIILCFEKEVWHILLDECSALLYENWCSLRTIFFNINHCVYFSIWKSGIFKMIFTDILKYKHTHSALWRFPFYWMRPYNCPIKHRQVR